MAACPAWSSGSGAGFAELERRTAIVGSRAGAAVPDVRVARFALDHGIAGLTFLRGIPGTIGGALRMNGGAYGGETKDVLVEAVPSIAAADAHVLSNADMHYSYRHCGAPEDLIFTAGRCCRAGRATRPTLPGAMEDITSAREATQPIKSRTGGSTFKNPPGTRPGS